MARADFQVLPQVALWSHTEIDTGMPTVKVIAETKVAAFIRLDREESLTQPSSMMILKITDSEKLHKLFSLRRQFIYKSSYSLMSS